jgi:P pilus assembly chaperone PapD
LTRAAFPAAFALCVALGTVAAQAQPAPTPAAAAPAAATAAPPTAVTAVTTVGANLNISPKRVTFDRTRRTATVYIYNQGTTAATFDITLIDRAMLPDGQIMTLADAKAKPELQAVASQVKSAQTMLMISPRRATLEPGKGQTIRLRVNAGPDAPTSGEFRSHLTITTIPPADVGLTAEDAAVGRPGELRFQVNSVFGLSIPAIVRIGEPDVRAGIENVHVDYADLSADGTSPPRRTPVLVFDLVRAGANSLFGNIEVRGATQRKGDPLGVARGVGVYTEIGRRTLRVPLNRALGNGEKLEITFSDDDTSPGKVLAKYSS